MPTQPEFERDLTEIEILPDGRICVFGTSVQVLEVLDELAAGTDVGLRRRLTATSRPGCHATGSTHTTSSPGRTP
ncbi:MAG: hypothetical protein WD851_20670 [Pirellulales bacterium]